MTWDTDFFSFRLLKFIFLNHVQTVVGSKINSKYCLEKVGKFKINK